MIEAHPLIGKILARALANERMAHAYFFSGPEGCGKREMALEFCYSLLCDQRSFPSCGDCGPCRRARAGSHPDLTVVEAEGRNIRIDQIRALGQSLRLHGFEGGFKAAVVIEAERMTLEAQNAFLKTLEEPPDDTALILTSANPSGALPTILSRCQRIEFSALPDEAVAEMVKGRGVSGDDAALVASLANGNARKAMQLDLDFVLTFRREMIERLMGFGPSDAAPILNFAEAMAKGPYPIEDSLDAISEFLRDVMYQKTGAGKVRGRDLLELVKREARRNGLAEVIGKMETVNLARRRALGNAHPRINWEILAMTLAGVAGAEMNSR